MSTLVSVLLYTGPETSACIMWSDMVAATIADKCFITNRTRIRQYVDNWPAIKLGFAGIFERVSLLECLATLSTLL